MTERKAEPTFALASIRWLNDVAALNKYGSVRSAQRIIARLNKTFGHMYISDIKKDSIQRFITALSQRSGIDSLGTIFLRSKE